MQCFKLRRRGTSTWNVKIYPIDGSKDCAKNECNTMIIPASRHKDPSSGANRPSDVAVTVNMNAEYNLSVIRWQLTA
jgi:hypothetical protein